MRKHQVPKKVYLTDLMSEKDKAKMLAFKLANQKAQSEMISREWLSLCELGFYYGWEAIKAFQNEEITIDQMHMYINGARKIHSRHVYDNLVATGASHFGGIKYADEMNKHIQDMREVN